MRSLEARMRHVMIHEGGVTWDDIDGISTASLLPRFHMPDIERYIGVGDLKGHLRLCSRMMRAHRLDDT